MRGLPYPREGSALPGVPKPVGIVSSPAEEVFPPPQLDWRLPGQLAVQVLLRVDALSVPDGGWTGTFFHCPFWSVPGSEEL